MSSIAFVTAQVIAQNEVDYIECGGKALQIPCEDIAVQGTLWFVPQIANGILTGYRPDMSADKPTTDSIHVLRILDRTKNSTYYILIADNADETVFTNLCNNCCDESSIMPVVTIPEPIIEEAPCPTVPSGTPVYDFQFNIPANPYSLDYRAPYISINGVVQADLAGPYADPTALLAAFTGTYGSAGTWTLNDDETLLLLSSTTTETAGVTVELIDESYCFEIPDTNTTVNGIKVGSPAQNVTFPQVTFNDTTESLRNAIVNAIQPYLNGTVEVVENTGTYYVKYTGQMLPVQLTLDGANVSGTAFASGTCP